MSHRTERQSFLGNKRNLAGMALLAATIGIAASDLRSKPNTESTDNPYATPSTTINMAEEIGTGNNLYTIENNETPVSKVSYFTPTPIFDQEINILSTMTGREIPIPEAVETPNS